MTSSTTIKPGATFSKAALCLLPTGTWSALCHLRRSDDTLVDTLTATLTALASPDSAGNTHSLVLEATSVQTSAWPVSTLRCDIRISDTSTPPVVEISETFVVVVEKAVTHD